MATFKISLYPKRTWWSLFRYQWGSRTLTYLTAWPRALVLFIKKGGPTLAASISFYAMLSIIPLLLLCFRLVGLWVKDLKTFKYHLFNVGKKMFPSVAPDLVNQVEKLVSSHLYASNKWTYLNLAILAFSALSMFTAISNGVRWITGKQARNGWDAYLKGLLLIFVTVLFLILSLSIPPLLKLVIQFVASNDFVEFAVKYVPPLESLHDTVKSIKIGRYFFFKSGLISFFIFLFYFTFVYKWFYPTKVFFKEAFASALSFVALLWGGKELFWIYLKFSKKGLVANYGANYTLIVGIMWIFILSSFFIYGICLLEYLVQRRQHSSEVELDPTALPSEDLHATMAPKEN